MRSGIRQRRERRAGLLTLVCLVGLGAAATDAAAQETEVLIDNAWVRITRVDRTAGTHADAPSAVAVTLENSQDWRVGDAFWLTEASGTEIGDFIILEPKLDGPEVEVAGGSAPGEADFVGLSFRELFADDHVEVLRARMEVEAREGFHTHGSHTIVVHLSGGSIEDTANGVTTVNEWQRGDVEWEGKGSSHEARNLGDPVDVILVVLK